MLLQSPPVIESNLYSGNIMVLSFQYDGTEKPPFFATKYFSKVDPAYPINLFNNSIYLSALASYDNYFKEGNFVSSKERIHGIINAIGTSIAERMNKSRIFMNVMFNPDVTPNELNDKGIREGYISKSYYFVLIGHIKYFYAAEPYHYTWGGNESGIAFAHTKFEELKLINICSGDIIWEGSVEGEKIATRERTKHSFWIGIKRLFENKESLWIDLPELQLSSLNEAINDLVLKLSKVKLPPPEDLGCKR